MHNLRGGRRILFDRQLPNRYREIKAPQTARPRIEVQHPFVTPDIRFVRMSEEDDRKLRRGWIQVNRLHIVQHVKVLPLEEQDLGLGEFAAFADAIDIPANGGDGRYLLEGFDYCEVAYIAEVEDVFDSAKCGDNLGPQEAVRIADNTNDHLPKLKRTGQRRFAFARSGLAIGSMTCNTEPGFNASLMAKQ